MKSLVGQETTNEFNAEVAVLKKLNHPNIVRYLGIFTDLTTKTKFIITEFMSKGSLRELLSQYGANFAVSDLLDMLYQVTSGMIYIESCNIVHRDLALRNVLITGSGADTQVKIADFGLSRKLEKNYLQTEDVSLPVRWTAPEALKYGKFSIKSDVWSYGVVVWEIFTFGEQPYTGQTNHEVVKALNAGERLEKPEKCPDDIDNLMKQCWNIDPIKRPSFSQINVILKNSIHIKMVQLHADEEPTISSSIYTYQTTEHWKEKAYGNV